MMRADHQAALEDLMADLDGELTPAESAAVRAHVAGCQACQEVETELRSVAGRMATWTVEEPPASLVSPVAASRVTRIRGWLPIAATLVVAAGAGTIWLANWKAAPELNFATPSVAMESASEGKLIYPKGSRGDSAPATAMSGRTAAGRGVAEAIQAAAGGTLLARTARLVLIVTGFDPARAEVERVIAEAGGFIGNLTISGDRGSPKSLRATLRVPGPALDDALLQLKRLGRVTSESRDAEDVTQQSTDLDARLVNARTSEKRLNDILASRTGDVTDVLNVEREIARVRGEIEQMDAARRNLDRRITYATIQLEMAEELKAALHLGDQSVSAKLRNALVGGWNAALNSVLDATLLVARVAPSLFLWGLALVIPYRMLRRRLAG